MTRNGRNGRPTAAYEAAVAVIRQEHHTLGLVMEMLRRLLSDIGKQHAEPDFALLAAALCYIDDFSERCHHPKEDRHLFETLRRRTAQFNDVLDALQSEHVLSAQMCAHLHCTLVHYQAGTADGLARFKDAVDAYAAMLRDHMQKEEELLQRSARILPEKDWQRIAGAFHQNDDPLFGDHQREEFRRLYLRIVNKLPRKIRLQLQRRKPEK